MQTANTLLLGTHHLARFREMRSRMPAKLLKGSMVHELTQIGKNQ
jgi:hypothetical protein